MDHVTERITNDLDQFLLDPVTKRVIFHYDILLVEVPVCKSTINGLLRCAPNLTPRVSNWSIVLFIHTDIFGVMIILWVNGLS